MLESSSIGLPASLLVANVADISRGYRGDGLI